MKSRGCFCAPRSATSEVGVEMPNLLDCCFNRPFDKCSTDRVFLEAEAVLSILRKWQEGQTSGDGSVGL